MWYLISGADLEELLEQEKDMVLVDMRDRQSYEKGHICGAVHIPGEELMSRLRRMFDETEAWLPKRRDKRTKAAAHTRRSLNTPTQTER